MLLCGLREVWNMADIKDDYVEINIPIELLNNICMECNGYKKLCVKYIDDFVSI